MSSNNKDGEQQFTIQPHPQDNHSNTPQATGPSSAKESALSGKPGPTMLDSESASKLEAPIGECLTMSSPICIAHRCLSSNQAKMSSPRGLQS